MGIFSIKKKKNLIFIYYYYLSVLLLSLLILLLLFFNHSFFRLDGFLKHVVFSLLKGRLVIIGGRDRHEHQVRRGKEGIAEQQIIFTIP